MKASAIISTYNSKKLLPHKIQNILESDAFVEVVIVDCSNDTADMSETNRIKIIKIPERITVWKAINIGIENAACDYVVQANTDDLVDPSAYRKQIIKLDEGFDIAYFDYHIVDGYHHTWERAQSKAYTTYITPAKGYSVGNGLGMFPMWRKSLHEDVGFFDENLEVYGDSLFWENLAKHGKKFGKIYETLGAYAQRPGQNLEVRLGWKDQEYLKNRS